MYVAAVNGQVIVIKLSQFTNELRNLVTLLMLDFKAIYMPRHGHLQPVDHLVSYTWVVCVNLKTHII